jgi:L,D-peptidoglycan transpeptidase YkuD (ErfK/YbiS/YcfS/YnhG family)
MRQLVTTPDLRCVDDPASRAYNMIVDVRDDLVGGPDWSSAERMLRSDGQYSLGVVVGHNDGIPLPGAGSCIFLHVRAAPDPSRTPGTAGCTAMDPKDMDTVARWLDPAANPVLVQLPQAEYERFKGLWGLP